jgi:hypothetical protein
MNDPQRRLQLAAARLGGAGEKVTLQDTIALSLDGLREMEDGEQAVSAFYALGAFAPKPETFSVEAAKAVAECDEAVLALLVARNLVALAGEGGEWLTLHQIVADVARTGLDEAAVARGTRTITWRWSMRTTKIGGALGRLMARLSGCGRGCGRRRCWLILGRCEFTRSGRGCGPII